MRTGREIWLVKKNESLRKNKRGLRMKQSQGRFYYLMEKLDEHIMSIVFDALTPSEKKVTETIICDLKTELEEYGLKSVKFTSRKS